MPLWKDVKEKCGECAVEEVLDALYNLQPGHAQLGKFVAMPSGYQLVSFERVRHTPKWKDFFYLDAFRVKVLPAGRVRYQRLAEQLGQEMAKAATVPARRPIGFLS